MSDKLPTKRARRVQTETTGWFAGYSREKKPLGGYAVLVGLFSIGLASELASASGEKRERSDLNWSDLLLLSIAAHKLSRIATKDLVTSPFRAPFVKFKESAGAGEVEEEARGEGLQEAVGDLISCPYCIAPWIASTLVLAFRRFPAATRTLSWVFSITAGSDFLNQLYARLKK